MRLCEAVDRHSHLAVGEAEFSLIESQTHVCVFGKQIHSVIVGDLSSFCSQLEKGIKIAKVGSQEIVNRESPDESFSEGLPRLYDGFCCPQHLF